MKKILLVVVLAAASLSGCAGVENRDVVELRAIHRMYRDHSKAKEAADQEKLNDLGSKIDSILGKMDEITR